MEVVENVLEGLANAAGGDLGKGLGDGMLWLGCGREFMLGGGEGKKVWCNPVEVTHVDSFVAFISEGDIRY